MDRRHFLATAGWALIAPIIPVPVHSTIGIDYAPLPDETVFRLLAYQKELIREVHRVTGIPRYQKGRDTWQDQIDAGQSEIVLESLNG
jgi:hypothetical protein